MHRRATGPRALAGAPYSSAERAMSLWLVLLLASAPVARAQDGGGGGDMGGAGGPSAPSVPSAESTQSPSRDAPSEGTPTTDNAGNEPGSPRTSVRVRTDPTTVVAGISEDEVLTRWLATSREVEYLRSAIGASRFDILQASLLPNPTLTLGTSTVTSGVPPDGQFNIGPQIEMPIPVGQISGRKRAAEAVLRTIEVDVVAALWERSTDIRHAMRERAFADARVHIYEQRLAELARVEHVVGARVSEGASSPYDTLRVGAAGATYVAALEGATIDRDRAEGALLALLCDPTLDALPITREGLAPFAGPEGEDALVRYALEHRPDLELARRGALARDAIVARWQRENRPIPSVLVGPYLTRGPSSVSIVGSVSITIPTFDRNQGQIGRARTEAEGQRALAVALEVRIRNEVVAAFRAREAASHALRDYRALGLGTRTEMLQRADVAFESGRFSIAELLDAYRALWEGREQELELEHELADAEVALERAAALTLEFRENGRPAPTDTR